MKSINAHIQEVQRTQHRRNIKMPTDITVSWWKLELKRTIVGNSLVAKWLGVCLPIQGVKVQSLVGKLRSPMMCGPVKKKIFFNWAIVKCLEKKGQDTPTEQKITIYFWSETMQTIGQQNDAVKLQKKIKNLPCPTAWSSIACQKHLSKMKPRRTSKKQNQREFLPSGNIEGSLGTAGKHHSGNERFWKWWMHGWIWKIFVFILKFFKKVINCFKPN